MASPLPSFPSRKIFAEFAKCDNEIVLYQASDIDCLPNCFSQILRVCVNFFLKEMFQKIIIIIRVWVIVHAIDIVTDVSVEADTDHAAEPTLNLQFDYFNISVPSRNSSSSTA